MSPVRKPRPTRRAAPVQDKVFALDAARITAALESRQRYRYVTPRVERANEGKGWRIVSPNCSRNIHADGGDIDIAWFEPLPAARWLVHARDHQANAWRAVCGTGSLAAALAIVCADEERFYWP